MIIKVYKYFKSEIIILTSLGLFDIIGSAIFTLYYYSGNGIDDCIMLVIGIPSGIAIMLLTFFTYRKQFYSILIEKNKCEVFSVFHKKICSVNYNDAVFYLIFDIKLLYSPPIKIIALSNTPFVCHQLHSSWFKKGFLGSFNRNKVIVIPYNETTIPFFNLTDWHCVE